MRDLGCAELWEKSLEQSLARRGRPRRASVELYRLKPERDLSSPRPLRESSAYWQIRRTAAERAAMPLSTAGGGAALALLAATTLPSLLGGRGAGTGIHAQAVTPASRLATSGKLTAAVTRALTTSKARGSVATTAAPVSAPSHPEATPERTTTEFAALQHPAASAHTTASHHAIADGAVLDGSVTSVQRLLGLDADGVLGPQTAAAIRSFQGSHGLAVDGIVGPATWAALTHTGKQTQTRSALAETSAAPVRATAAVVSDAVHARRSTPVARAATPTAGPAGAVSHRATRAAVPTTNPVYPTPSPATKAAATTPTSAPATHHPAPTTPTSTANATGGASAGPVAPAPRAPVTKVTPQPKASHLTGVQALQARLGITVDGDFGPVTTAAVERFQRAHGLTPNGVVGSATRAALGLGPGPVLKQAGATTTPTTPTNTASQPGGATGGSSIGTTTPSTGVTAEIAEMVAAGNAIATRPYVYGGGHGSFNSIGYDCSGSVSYVLHAAGLLSAPEDSSQLESYGAPGPGRYVTVYADAGHAWMTIDGRRFDTVALQETGTRWSSTMASTAGYVVRHPVGL